jgi:non-ribosomal peptide synthetase component F
VAEVQHALNLSGTSLFNTALSYRRLAKEQKAEDAKVFFTECVPTYDPTEYPLSVNIEASDENAAITLDYWTDYISDGQAVNVGSAFLQCLRNIIHHSEEILQNLDHFSNEDAEQVSKWNSQVPTTIEDSVHAIIERKSYEQPSAPAICAWDAEFTYYELSDCANRLAPHLSR